MRMVWILWFAMFVVWPSEGRGSSHFDEEITQWQTHCTIERIEGSYSETKASYRSAGNCRLDTNVVVLWTGTGAYTPKDGFVQEVVTLNGNPPARGHLNVRMFCSADPWLGTATCINGKAAADGEVASVRNLLDFIALEIVNSSGPATARLGYDRNALQAKRNADLQAEAAQARAEAEAKAQAELNARNSRLFKGAQQQPLIAPTILAPLARSLYLSNTSVPIKIAPPQGIAATGYVVRLEKQNAQGAWTPVSNLPIGAAEAASPSGYLGWGAPGNGRGAAMIAGPGTYRLSAQVSSPRQTVWSPWIEFVVTTPNKAIQRAPKMFGQ